MNKFPELSDVLQYKNKYIIERYCKDFNSSPERAEELFLEMLKFIWISVKNGREKREDIDTNSFIAIYHEMTEIDNMWHTFILFTKDYFNFSEKYFGHYIHHSPTTSDEPKLSAEESLQQFEKFLSYVYDHLGEQTLKKWFAEYCV